MQQSPYRELLQKATALFDSMGIVPCIGLELEFYALGVAEAEAMSGEIMAMLASDLAQGGIDCTRVDKERGKGQFEIALHHRMEPVAAADELEKAKEIIVSSLEGVCLEPDFSAKPFPEEFGSGLHIHISLHDAASGDNLFRRTGENAYSLPLQHTVGGLLASMRECMIFFAPYAQSYTRFVPNANAPVTVSWGANNRTVALRLPPLHSDSARHIEHRVAGSDANPYLATAAVLVGAYLGIREELTAPEQIFGDASLAMYNLEMLPTSQQEAEKILLLEGGVRDILHSLGLIA